MIYFIKNINFDDKNNFEIDKPVFFLLIKNFILDYY